MQVLALAILTLVGASSFPDNSNCSVYDPNLGEGRRDMDWVKIATRSVDYTIRTGDGCQSLHPDPSTYAPGSLMGIHIRTIRFKRNFRGFLLYAVNAAGERVGDWELAWPNSNMFWKPANYQCEDKSVMHLNGAEKYYHHELQFRAPPVGTGPVTFHCLIKRGEASVGGQPSGEFYWPMLQDLTISEGPVEAPQWFAGSPQSNCATTCAQQGSSCNANLMNSAASYNSRLEKDTATNVLCNLPVLESCTLVPTRDAEGWCTFPGRDCPDIVDACSALAPAGIQPICACGTGSVSMKVLNPASVSCLHVAEDPGDSAAPAKSQLGVVVALFASLFFLSSKQHGMLMVLACGVLLCAPAVSAHNWVGKISRSNDQASTYKPCRPRVDPVNPHWQIGGTNKQEFTVEWATGHNHFFYFTVVRASDITMMENTTTNMLNQYIDGAAGASGVTDYMALGSRWHKQHMNRDIDKNPDEMFELNISKAMHPTEYIDRHEKFGVPSNNAVRWRYKAINTVDDKRVSYYNADMPWLVAVHRFVQIPSEVSRAGDDDIARFTIDLSAQHRANGWGEDKYIVQYLWRGYFDCIDVDYFDTPVTTSLIGGRPLREDEPQWDKVDHCQFEEYLTQYQTNIQTSCKEVVTNADRCLTDCSARTNCEGVNVVPMWNPTSVYPGFLDEVNIPFGVRNCNRDQFGMAGPDTTVCYGVRARNGNSTHSRITVTDDPEDPVFYSSCYIKKTQWVFDRQLDTGVVVLDAPAELPPWSFSEQCVDCNEWYLAQTPGYVPKWKIPDYCVRCDADYVPDEIPIQGSVLGQGMSCDGSRYDSTAAKPIWNYQPDNCDDGRRCLKRLYLLATSTRDAMGYDECLAMAAADAQCSSVVRFQHVDGNQCECWRADPCCGKCNAVDHYFADWEYTLYDVNEAVGDPYCDNGIKSADGKNCCPASCGVDVCPSVPDYKFSFQTDQYTAPAGWTKDSGKMFGTDGQWGWSCDMTDESADREADDGNNFASTSLTMDENDSCNAKPFWEVELANGDYHVELLYSQPYRRYHGCEIEGGAQTAFDGTSSLGGSNMQWTVRDGVTVADGRFTFTGANNENCDSIAAITITAQSKAATQDCRTAEGLCCANRFASRSCNDAEAPCRIDPNGPPAPSAAPPAPTAAAPAPTAAAPAPTAAAAAPTAAAPTVA